VNNKQIDELSHASSDDELVLYVQLPDRIFGFHDQQAVEKLLKMLILGNGQRHEFTHDIQKLTDAAKDLGEVLPAHPFPIADLTDYAGGFRYTEPKELTPIEPDNIRETVRILRQHVDARLIALNA
jgi:HEPN domain-containing protein